ncbi:MULTISPECIES: hypothetical protein [unclassified Clostridium]|uniref:hypothetical protein n=1 Tax=unclassified Clostridium TaxID=2614128 RepID=UPI0025C411B2|nr:MULTISPECIES: hypothetical protein [unclassified Clostridium]
MITDKDRKVLRYVDEFGFITIKQCYYLVYSHMVNGYEYARTRLQRLVKEKRLKIITNSALKLKLFIPNDSNKSSISEHRIYLMDFYCELIKNNVTIEYFKPEKEWLNGKYRSDALCIYRYGDYRFRSLIEVNKSNNRLDLNRFENAAEEIMECCGGKLPNIILLDDRKHKSYDTDMFTVIRLDYKLNNFGEIFL